MNSYFYVDSIAKMLVARPDNGVIRNDVTKSRRFQFKKSFYVPFFKNDITKMVRSSKILMSPVAISMFLDIK